MPPSCALLGGFAIGARVALLWQHYGNAWQSPAVIRQAHRTPHAGRTRTLRMPAKTPLAGDKIDEPAACAVPFRPYCGGIVTRTRNVSEYVCTHSMPSFCILMILSFSHLCYTVYRHDILSNVPLSNISQPLVFSRLSYLV